MIDQYNQACEMYNHSKHITSMLQNVFMWQRHNIDAQHYVQLDRINTRIFGLYSGDMMCRYSNGREQSSHNILDIC